MDSLKALYHKVSPGGFIIVDDFNDFEPCRRAVLEFRDEHGIKDPIEKIDGRVHFGVSPAGRGLGGSGRAI